MISRWKKSRFKSIEGSRFITDFT